MNSLQDKTALKFIRKVTTLHRQGQYHLASAELDGRSRAAAQGALGLALQFLPAAHKAARRGKLFLRLSHAPTLPWSLRLITPRRGGNKDARRGGAAMIALGWLCAVVAESMPCRGAGAMPYPVFFIRTTGGRALTTREEICSRRCLGKIIVLPGSLGAQLLLIVVVSLFNNIL